MAAVKHDAPSNGRVPELTLRPRVSTSATIYSGSATAANSLTRSSPSKACSPAPSGSTPPSQINPFAMAVRELAGHKQTEML